MPSMKLANGIRGRGRDVLEQPAVQVPRTTVRPWPKRGEDGLGAAAQSPAPGSCSPGRGPAPWVFFRGWPQAAEIPNAAWNCVRNTNRAHDR